jgi:hypothetical protein
MTVGESLGMAFVIFSDRGDESRSLSELLLGGACVADEGSHIVDIERRARDRGRKL